jgi:hypothetical protein
MLDRGLRMERASGHWEPEQIQPDAPISYYPAKLYERYKKT